MPSRRDMLDMIFREAPGAKVTTRGSGHLCVHIGKGKRRRCVICAATPSDKRAIMNARAALRRMMKEIEA